LAIVDPEGTAMSPPKKPQTKADSDELSDLWLKASQPAKHWIGQAVLNLVTSPLPVPLLLDKLQRDAQVQPELNKLLQDVNMSIEDKFVLFLMLMMKKLDADIQAQTSKATSNAGGAPSIDVETQKLQRMVQKRAQMFDMMSKIMDQYSTQAKNMVQNLGR
jgi:methyl-accepting chemotaxis protein